MDNYQRWTDLMNKHCSEETTVQELMQLAYEEGVTDTYEEMAHKLIEYAEDLYP